VRNLLSELGLQYETVRLEALVGTKVHTKEQQKISVALPAEEVAQKAYRFRQLIARRMSPGRAASCVAAS
jgi:hypothetical protein